MLRDLQSQTRNDLSYPADTTTEAYSLNFTAFTWQRKEETVKQAVDALLNQLDAR